MPANENWRMTDLELEMARMRVELRKHIDMADLLNKKVMVESRAVWARIIVAILASEALVMSIRWVAS